MAISCKAPSTKQLTNNTEFQKGGKHNIMRSFEKIKDILNAIMSICLLPDFKDNLCQLFAKRKEALLHVL